MADMLGQKTHLTRLIAEHARCARRIVQLEAALRRVIDHYDARAEMYTSADDLAAGMAAIAKQQLMPRSSE